MYCLYFTLFRDLGRIILPVVNCYSIRKVEAVAKAEAPQGSLGSLLSMGKKLASQAWGEGATQINFDKNKLRVKSYLLSYVT